MELWHRFWGEGSSSASGQASGSKRRGALLQLNDSLYEFHRPDCTPKMQIVFIHGIHLGDSTDAHLDPWESEDGTLWPQSWLGEEFPAAHIYAAAYSGGVGKSQHESSDLYIIAMNLLHDMIHEKIGQLRHCPVVLVGYDFGGIVIKEVCLLASKQRKNWRQGQTFLDNVRGIFYYGTPHHGFPTVSKQADRLQSPLLTYLKPLSVHALRLNHDFHNLREIHANWRIHGIGESLPTKSNLFPNVVAVPEASARHREDFFVTVRADHNSISKPASKLDKRFSALKDLLHDIDGASEEKPRPENFQRLPQDMTDIHDEEEAIVSKLETVTTLGLVGMGGVGKTTLAKAVFNILSPRFDYTCFVSDVKLIRGREDDVKEELWKCLHFQGRKVGGERNLSVLRGKRLLLGLDDISDRDIKVLLDLAEDTDPASRFIWTSREREILKDVGAIYEVHVLTEKDAKLLFMKHAFPEGTIPDMELESLVEDIVRKCGGLPLTLQVLGKYLRGKEHPVWKDTLSVLQRADKVKNLDERLWAKLRPSFESLGENEKEMFLDATNFFYGNWKWTLRAAKMAWQAAYGEVSEQLWQTLVNMSLVYNVGEEEYIKVNKELVSLAKMVASDPGHDGKYQVWKCKALNAADGALELFGKLNALHGKEVRALRLVSDIDLEVSLVHGSNTAFSNLKNLRFLEIDRRIQFVGAMNDAWLPTQLVLLQCAGQVFFNPALQKDLAVLKLSDMEYVPSSIGELSKLSHLEIQSSDGSCHSLPESLGSLVSLTVLRINCTALLGLPQSFGCLQALQSLIISSGFELRSLPYSFGSLSALRHLIFDSCQSLQSLPESFGQLSALEHLAFDFCTSLERLPESFGRLASLNHLEFEDCSHLRSLPESFGYLAALTHLEFDSCENLQALLDSFGNLSSLSHLEFRNCGNLRALPHSFGNLSSLSHLEFRNCGNLRDLPKSFEHLVPALNHLIIEPDSFGLLSALSHLRFEHENLQFLPESVAKSKVLDSVPLSTSIRTAEETASNVPGLNLRHEAEIHEQGIDTPQLETRRLNSGKSHKMGSPPQSLDFFEHPTPYGDKSLVLNLDKAKSDSYVNEQEKGEFVDEQKGPVVDLARRADEFIRDVEKGGKYGYFVSSKCLLRLDESQRQSLMAILWEAGYSEIYRTTTTTLFARLKNDEENRTTPYGASSALKERPVSRRDVDDVGPSKGDDDLLGSVGRGVNLSRSCNVTDIFESNNPAGTSSIKSFEGEISPAGDPLETGTLSREDALESQFCENVTTEMSEPTPTPSLERIEQKQPTSVPAISTKPPTIAPAEQQSATLRSFKAALKSKSYPSFCVSRRWLSDLKDDEQKALLAILEAGYKKIYETGTDTWYERLEVRVQSPGDGEVGDDSSSSSKRSSVAGGDITKSGASKSRDSLAPGKGKRNVNDDDTSDTSGSPSRDTTENKRNEDFSCSPRRLKVACSSLAQTPSILPSSRDEIIEQYGDEEFVTMPNLRRRGVYLISTSIDRRFSIPAISFSDEGHAVMGTKSMNAKAISSLSCCVDHRNLKVRFKFSKFSGEIRGIDPNEQQSNVVALSCLGTSVSGFTRKTKDEDDFEPVALHLDELYHPHSQGRPVEKSITSDDVLVWLKLSSSHANNSSSASITLGLQADADKRLANDLETNVRRAHTLSFDNARRPVIFEGILDEGIIDEESHLSESFLELQVRYRLEVCYFEPSIWGRDTSLFCPCSPLTTQPVDLNCCLTIRSENL